ncbi:hypothetical protein OIU78_005040, partial [Salix suchowensis]
MILITGMDKQDLEDTY